MEIAGLIIWPHTLLNEKSSQKPKHTTEGIKPGDLQHYSSVH